MKSHFLFILLAVLVVAVALTVIIGLVGFNAPEFRIFTELDELSFLDEYTVGQLDDDEGILEGLSVVDRKCIEVDFNESRFRVYAYVFLNEADAKAYFDRANEIMKKTNGWHYRVYQSNRAFFANGPSRNSGSFKALLYENFSSIVKYI